MKNLTQYREQKMKHIKASAILATLLCSLTSLSAQATNYDISGTVKRFVSKHNDITTNTLHGTKVFLNSTTTQAGTCNTHATDGVIMWLRVDHESDNRMFSMLLAAQMANRAVTITVSDAHKDSNGVCYVQSVTMQ